MSGIEIVGATAVAAALVELSSRCTKKLVHIRKACDDVIVRDLLKHVELLTETISDFFGVLHHIYTQPVEQHQSSDAESTVWDHMKRTLLLCQQQLDRLYQQLNTGATGTNGFVNRSKEAFKLSISLSDLKRIKEDINTYVNALNMFKSFLQLLATQRQNTLQRAMHRDLLENKENYDDKFEAALRDISRIKDELRQQLPLFVRTDSTDAGHYGECTPVTDDPSDTLSVYLEQIMIAAAAHKEVIHNPPLSVLSGTPSSNPPNSPTVDELTEIQPMVSVTLPQDSLPDITHVEPLKELAICLKTQAEIDFEHGHYQSAEFHQSQSIKCYEELHDVHWLVFETYDEMKMTLATIFLKQGRYLEAHEIAEHQRPLRYDSALGCRAVPSEIDEDADRRALRSEFMANIRLEMYQSDSSSDYLSEAEKHAKRAFQLRREIHGRNSLELKTVVKILVKIYSQDPKKAIYAEVYRDLYLNKSSREQSIGLSHRTFTGSSIPVPTSAMIIDAISNHNEDDEHEVTHLIDQAAHAGVDFSDLVDGSSAMMVAIDHNCDRCVSVIDKLLSYGAGYEMPFHYAVKKGNLARCKQLLKFGADINWPDRNQMTPLMHAIKQEHLDMVAFLITNGANPNVPSDDDRTALHMAIETRNVDTLKLLLEKKEHVYLDLADARGLTALHYCAKLNQPGLAKRLVRAGADLEIRDKSAKQRTALWIAIKEGKYLFAEILLKLNAEVDLTYLPTSTGDFRRLLEQYAVLKGEELYTNMSSTNDDEEDDNEKSDVEEMSLAQADPAISDIFGMNAEDLFQLSADRLKDVVEFPSTVAGSERPATPQRDEVMDECNSFVGTTLEGTNSENHDDRSNTVYDEMHEVEAAYNDCASVASNDEDIGSQLGASSRTSAEIYAVRLFGSFFGELQVLREQHQLAITTLGKGRFIRNYRRILKSYILRLRQRAGKRTRVEDLTIRVIQSRRNREDIARDVVDLLQPGDTNSRDAFKLLNLETRDKRHLAMWIDKLRGGAIPEQEVDHVQHIASHLNDVESDEDEETQESPDIYKDLDKYLPVFVAESNEFLWHEIETLDIELRLLTLRAPLKDIIQSTPKTDIHISTSNNTTIWNRCKAFVEDNTCMEWDWWPLEPRVPDVPVDRHRLQWRVAGQTFFEHVSISESATLSHVLARTEDHPINCYCCTVNRKQISKIYTLKYWLDVLASWFTGYARSFSNGQHQTSAAGQRYTPTGASTLGSTMNSAQSISGLASSIQSSSNSSSSFVQTSDDGTNTFVALQQYIRHCIIFGIRHASGLVDVENVMVSCSSTNDPVFFAELKKLETKYRWPVLKSFSPFIFDYCQFVPFESINVDQVFHRGEHLPEDQGHEADYEYHPRPPMVKNPLLDRYEFQQYLRACSPLCPWTYVPFSSHRCFWAHRDSHKWKRIPRKKGEYMRQVPGEVAFGIKAMYTLSFPIIFVYHVVSLFAWVGFCAWWLDQHPGDLQNASIPLTVFLGVAASFWILPGRRMEM